MQFWPLTKIKNFFIGDKSSVQKSKPQKASKSPQKIPRELHTLLKTSFSNVKSDITNLHAHINAIKQRHLSHDQHIKNLQKRLEAIELHLGLKNLFQETTQPQQANQPQAIILTPKEHKEISTAEPELTLWDALTETEQKICWKLALLQKETPNQWLSQKYLAQELYPNKEYSKIRSTLSQFISNLEELGFIKRKRSGKQAYIYLIKDKKLPKAKKIEEEDSVVNTP